MTKPFISHHTLVRAALLCTLILAANTMAPSGSHASEAGQMRDARRPLPFQPGEKLRFLVRWSVIPAGEAILEVLPPQVINGRPCLHFVMTARTYPFVDLFYKVRDRIESFTDLNMTYSLLYRKEQKGKSYKDVEVTLDWEKREARYSNHGRKRKPIPLIPGSFDPLSVFYAFRLLDLENRTELKTPVTDGKKCVMGKARVIGKERVHLPKKSYDTYLVIPELKHVGGVFQKSKDADLKIWVSADRRRIPVKIESKVAVGSFVAELHAER